MVRSFIYDCSVEKHCGCPIADHLPRSSENQGRNICVFIFWWFQIRIPIIDLYHMLVGALQHEFYECRRIGNFIIPTDERLFFRGVGIPPTRHVFWGLFYLVCQTVTLICAISMGYL